MLLYCRFFWIMTKLKRKIVQALPMEPHQINGRICRSSTYNDIHRPCCLWKNYLVLDIIEDYISISYSNAFTEKIAVTHGFIIVNMYCQLNQRIRLLNQMKHYHFGQPIEKLCLLSTRLLLMKTLLNKDNIY